MFLVLAIVGMLCISFFVPFYVFPKRGIDSYHYDRKLFSSRYLLSFVATNLLFHRTIFTVITKPTIPVIVFTTILILFSFFTYYISEKKKLRSSIHQPFEKVQETTVRSFTTKFLEISLQQIFIIVMWSLIVTLHMDFVYKLIVAVAIFFALHLPLFFVETKKVAGFFLGFAPLAGLAFILLIALVPGGFLIAFGLHLSLYAFNAIAVNTDIMKI